MKTSISLCLITILALSCPVLISGDSDASATYKISFSDTEGIKVEFPNTAYVQEGGTLVFTASSDKYNLGDSGIILYKSGTTEMYKLHNWTQNGTAVTYTFENIVSDAEIVFTELITFVPTDTPGVDPEVPSEEITPDEVPSEEVPTPSKSNTGISVDPLLFSSIVVLLISVTLLIHSLRANSSFGGSL